MEYFRKKANETIGKITKFVLILVVMEYFRKSIESLVEFVKEYGLNPCCNGILSKAKWSNMHLYDYHVLILVVMEYFRKKKTKEKHLGNSVLILVVMEYFRKFRTKKLPTIP